MLTALAMSVRVGLRDLRDEHVYTTRLVARQLSTVAIADQRVGGALGQGRDRRWSR